VWRSVVMLAELVEWFVAHAALVSGLHVVGAPQYMGL
jgi:hypothetical protein